MLELPEGFDAEHLRYVLLDFDRRLAALEQAAAGYQVTGLSAQRDLDAVSAPLADVRSVLATLISDLKTAGRLA